MIFTPPCDLVFDPLGLKHDIDTLRAAGIPTIVAAGNDFSTNQMSYPACLSSTIKVVALTKSNTMASYSNRAPAAEATTLAAPGGDNTGPPSAAVCSSVLASLGSNCTNPGSAGTFAAFSGTSMATPHVAGAWALLKQAKPAATVDEILSALRASAVGVFDPASSTTFKKIQLQGALSRLVARLSPLTASVTSPQLVGTSITFTATATGGTAPYQFKWWLWNGARWTIVQDWSASPTFTWAPTIANAGYQIIAWVRSAGNTADFFEDYKQLAFAIMPPAPTALTAITSDKMLPQGPGTTITFTAAASGGTTPYQFKWWLWNGTMWTIVRDWGASASFAWTPTVPNRDYQIIAWVRSAGNTVDLFEDYKQLAAPITPPAPAMLTGITSDKMLPQGPGTTITFTAAATGGSAPYQFKWWLWNGAMWTIVQDWTATNMFMWTPGVPNLNYQVIAWVRSAGDTLDTFETYRQLAAPIAP